MGVHPDIQRLIHDTFGSLTSDCVPEGAALEQLADDALAEHRRGETEPVVHSDTALADYLEEQARDPREWARAPMFHEIAQRLRRMVPDRLPQIVALTLRLRRLESALNDVNNHLQKYEFRIAELEREAKVAKRERQAMSATIDADVRSITEAMETERAVA